MKMRTYPRADLSKVGFWIDALSEYGLPLLEITSRKLKWREAKNQVDSNTVDKIKNWKASKSINDPDELEYKYLLEGMDTIRTRKLESEDLIVPITENLTIGDILGTRTAHVKIHFLTRLGIMAHKPLAERNYRIYEAMLFWLLIRSKRFNPLLQNLLSDYRAYEGGVRDDFIPSRDGISRSLVSRWLLYFGILHDSVLEKSRISQLLHYATLFELNEMLLAKKELRGYVGEICKYLSEAFSIPQGIIDYYMILDSFYRHLSNEYVVGFPTGRGHTGLPSKPKVQLLEFRKPIPIKVLDDIHDSEFISIIGQVN